MIILAITHIISRIKFELSINIKYLEICPNETSNLLFHTLFLCTDFYQIWSNWVIATYISLISITMKVNVYENDQFLVK